MNDLSERLVTALRERYVIEGAAGSGGMATVYVARDVRHGRRVAIKVLRPDQGAAAGAERFRREIEIAARLQHPNILPVFDSGTADDALFYVMPFIPGDSLRARLDASHALPLPEALHVTREVADALAFAHRNGIVHRDIKPENILFSSGHALVADFGIARLLGDSAVSGASLTLAGFGVGTPVYMSPEQAFAEAVDARTDQYALGCVMYEMLTGGAPFADLPAGALLLHKTTRDVPPPVTDPPLPAHVEGALLRALARDADERFATMEEFVGALDAPIAPPPPPRPARRAVPSIAVLPFSNSGSPDDRYFSEGLADELIHALGATTGLRVLGHATAFALGPVAGAGTVPSQPAVPAGVQVDVLLRGSVRRGGDRLRVMAHLVDATSGFELWSQRYDRDATDVFAIQDDITRCIVEALRAELLASPGAAGGKGDLGAYDRYLKARFQWNRRSVSGMQASVGLLREAIDLDASYAPALAALAETHVTLAVYGVAAPAEAMRDARAAAERALALSPGLGEARSALACVRALWDWDYAAATAEFTRAVELSPQYPTAHQWFATHAQLPRGQFALAFRQLMRAYELDPLSPSIAVSLGLTHFYARDHGEAAAAFRALLSRDAEFAPAHAFLGQVQAEMGDTAAGLASLESALRLGGEAPEWVAAAGVVRARGGDADGARATLARLRELGAGRYVSPVLPAQVHAALGEVDSALDAIDDAILLRATDLAWIGIRPAFDPLRGHPRFSAALATVGLA